MLKIYFSKHHNFFENTTILAGTQLSWQEHNYLGRNSLFENTTILVGTKQSFQEHYNLFQNTKFSDTQMQLKHIKIKWNKTKFQSAGK